MTDPAARRWSRRAVLGAALVLTASACNSTNDRDSTDEQGAPGGLKGVTDVDVGCPPSPDATPCPRRPLAARLRIIRQDRDVPDVDIRSGDDGTFTVALLPGRYEVVPDNITGAPYPRADRLTVEVHEDEFARITVMFDSGVR